MNRVIGAVTAPLRVGAMALAATGQAFAAGTSILFARSRGFVLYLARTRIDYRAEVGDPATNSIVGTVVDWIARNLPAAPLRIVREDTTEIAYTAGPTGPGFMLRLLKRPNPAFDGYLQWMATIVDWLCRGNAYWLKVRAPGGRVKELWWVPERFIKPAWPKDDATVFIGWYEYTIDGVTHKLRPDDVVHFRYGINPDNPREGLSPLASLFREIFTDDEAANFTASLLRNLGVPGVTISPANTTGAGGKLGGLDPEDVKKKFMDKFTGDNRGQPFVSNLPIEVKKVTFSPQEMDLKALRRIPEERISARLGVPAGVAQLGAGLDRNTFTNYGEGNVAAYTQGVIPKQDLLTGTLETQLLPEFADLESEGLDLWFDWTQVPAMQAFAAAVWKLWESSATKGLVTRAAFKKAVGQTVLPGDEVYVMPNNFVTTAAGAGGANASPGALSPGRAPRQLAAVATGEVRCERCDKLLADAATPPYRLTCRHCRHVNEATLEEDDAAAA